MADKKPLILSSLGELQQMQTGDTLGIANGGTGATTASQALTNLGAYPASNPNNYITAGGAPVQSVAGRTGAVVLSASDISGLHAVSTSGSYLDLTNKPSKLSDFTNDANFITAGGAPVQSVAGRTGAVVLSAADVSGVVASTEKGVANGVATLGADGKLSTTQIPSSLVGSLNYQGTWNASTNTPTIANGVGTKGFYYKVSVAGTTNIDGTNSWRVGDMIVFNGTTWDSIDGGGSTEVSTVAGRTGAVVLSQSDITGLKTTDSPTFAAVTATTFTGNLTGNATNVTGTVAIGNGGTGATTASQALINLGAYPATNPNNYIAASGAPVQSVAGRTGAVTLSQADITGLKTSDSPTFAAVTAGTFNGLASQSSSDVNTLSNTSGVAINIGMPVYLDNTGGVQAANAASLSTSDVFGLSVGNIAVAGSGVVVRDGDIVATAAQWNAIGAGASGLTPGATYFLSGTGNGTITTTPPTSGFVIKIGKALSATKLSVNIGPRIQL